MKKTFFLNSKQICEAAKNWSKYYAELIIQKEEEKRAADIKKDLEKRKLEFLNMHAKELTRIDFKPAFFYETNREMMGKYGWFCSYGKYYNLPEYYTGWVFESEEKYNEFLNLK